MRKFPTGRDQGGAQGNRWPARCLFIEEFIKMASKFNFEQVRRNFEEEVKRTLPVKLANQAQNFFAGSFRNQGFTDSSLVAWETPKRRIEGTPEWKYPKSKGLGRRTKATLVKSGRLRRAVQDCIKEVTFERIRLLIDVPYAKFHNDGTDKLPQRKFIGDSVTLRAKQKELINTTILKIFEKNRI